MISSKVNENKVLLSVLIGPFLVTSEDQFVKGAMCNTFRFKKSKNYIGTATECK